MNVFISGNCDYNHCVTHKRISDSNNKVNALRKYSFSDLDDFLRANEESYVVITNIFQNRSEVCKSLALSLGPINHLQDILWSLKTDLAFIKGIIYLSDISICGEPKYLPVDETHQIDNKNNLSLANIFGEKLLNDFYLEHRIPTIILRCPHVIGKAYGFDPREYPFETNVINNLILKNIEGGGNICLDVFENEFSENTYIHVSDLANAINRCVEVMEVDRTSGIINLGSEICALNFVKIKEAYEKIFNFGISFEKKNGERIPNYSFVSYEKALNMLEPWSPKWTLEDTFKFIK